MISHPETAMSFPRSTLLALVFVLTVAGCAAIDMPTLSQQAIDAESRLQFHRTLVRQQKFEQDLLDMIWPLRVKNTHICQNMLGKTLGFSWKVPVQKRGSLSLEEQVANDFYGFQGQPVVTKMASESPAAKAGLQIGDRIASVGTWQHSADRPGKFNDLLGRRLNQLKAKGDVHMDVWRGDERLSLSIAPVDACLVQIEASLDLDVFAYTDGRQIVVSRGLIERLDDEEIRTVIAHELAHCVMGHLRTTVLNTIAGVSIDLAMLAQRVWLGGVFAGLSRDMQAIRLEREADYVSMYLLANAGFDTADRSSLWRKMADESSYVMTGFTTHPHSPERYILLKQAHEEIEAKRKAGQVLLPEGMSRSH